MVSIIIPIYNSMQYLKECFESIRSQTYKYFEVLMINDGSLDRSEEICKQYEKKDSRFHLINQSNMGASAARNNGLKHAAGEYIVFVDSDDKIPEYFLEDAFSKIIFYDADVVIGGCQRTNPKKVRLPNIEEPKIYDFTEIDALKKFCLAFCAQKSNPELISCSSIMSPWGKIIKKNVIKDMLFQENLVLDEDTIFSLGVLDNSERVVLVPSIYYIWRNTEDSLSYNTYRPNIVTELTSSDKFFEDYVKNHMDTDLNKELKIRRVKTFERCLNYYYCNRKNPHRFRIKELRSFMKSEPYRSALRTANLSEFFLSRKTKIYIWLGKKCLSLITIFFHSFCKMEDQIKGKVIFRKGL